MSLFYVQDTDRSMYVLAKDYTEALGKWRKLIRMENPDDISPNESIDPLAISFIADNDDIIL